MLLGFASGCTPQNPPATTLQPPVHVHCPFAPDPATLKIDPLPAPPPPPQGANVTPAKPISIIGPRFPDCAVTRKLSGIADFAFTVGPDGSVSNIKLLQEVPAGFGFAEAAEAVIPTWKYQPRLVDGKPVAFEVTYRVRTQYQDPTTFKKELAEKAAQGHDDTKKQ